MAEASNAVPFDSSAEWEDSAPMDNTCPECGTESIVSYIDRYSTSEYCTNCNWSDEDDRSDAWEPMGRKAKDAEEA